MLFGEIVSASFENRMKHVHALRTQTQSYLLLKRVVYIVTTEL
jgi:hypothetical protein